MNHAIIQDQRKIVVITASSGAGKTTICKEILLKSSDFLFSVSATNRQRRKDELNEIDYHFVTDEKFKQMIIEDELLEYEEVYPGRFYGTPRSEIERILIKEDRNMLIDVDIKGAISIKEKFPDAKIIYLAPPSIEELKLRLEKRGDTSQADMKIRLAKAEEEMRLAEEKCADSTFNAKIINREIDLTKQTTLTLVSSYIRTQKSSQPVS